MNKYYKAISLFIALGFIYTYSLDIVPVHLNRDELGFALNAYSISQTGFDENGRFFPLYFWHLGVMWATPIIVYLTALFLTILPLSEVSIRLPSILIGFLNLALIYFLAKKIFKSEIFGLLATVFLAFTPIHFIQSRILLDNLFPIPFVLGWMLLLYLFFSKKNLWFLFFAALLLGIGIHSYHATKIMMPIYLLFTFWLVWFRYRGNKGVITIPLFAFILPLLPLIPWLAQYPDTLTDQIHYVGLYNSKLSILQGLATLLTPAKIGQMIIVYLKYFDPIFIFFKGDSSLIHSTGQIGMFLLSYAILLPIGIYQAFKQKGWFNVLLLVGFFTAPVAAAFVNNEYRASKELFILPFAALLATLAAKSLLNSSRKLLRILCGVLIVSMSIQFSFFLNDYFNDYRIRSYTWFDYDILGSLEVVLAEDRKAPASFIYFDDKMYYHTNRYWKFALIRNKREDLLAKTYLFDPLSVSPGLFRPNSIVLYRFDHLSNLLQQPPFLRLVKSVLEPDNTSSFYIYRN